MKSFVLIGLSRHRIGVDGEGVTTLVAFHGCLYDVSIASRIRGQVSDPCLSCEY